MKVKMVDSYTEYAAITLMVALGLLGVVNFGGIARLSFEVNLGVILATYGIYTLAYLAVRLSRFEKAAKNYFIIWGYIPAAMGISLILTPIVSILLALSISLIGLAVVALLILRL